LKLNKTVGPDEILPGLIKKWRSHIKTETISVNSEDMETRKKIPYEWS
jgi:hypothetical protein